jgi:hypothetical protein
MPTPSATIAFRGFSEAVRGVTAALLAVSLLAVSGPADARSSGGYSRPSMSSSHSSSSYHSSSSSHSSSGYARPSLGSRSDTRSTYTPSAGDRAVSRRSSGGALDQFRTNERRTAPSDAGWSWRPDLGGARDTGSPWRPARPSFETTYRSTATEGWGWRPPDYIRPTQSSYSGWNPFLFWLLLDRLNRPDHANFFHHHEDDSGYLQWRAEAERLARNDPELRGKLDALDATLAAKRGEPRNPGYLPSGISAASAHAAAAPADAPASGGLPWRFLLIVLMLGCAVAFIVYVGRRHAMAAAGQARGGSMDGLKTAANILRQKMSGTPVTLKPFRVGMALTLDPTPFILAQGATKVPVPKAQGQTAFASVQAIGRIEGAPLHRLHLDDSTFIQIHLDGNRPDECRYFAQIDEVEPADTEEWKVWLERDQGMIGWPQFQTKDNKLYDRVWSPGAQWIAPIPYVEALEGKAASPSVKGVMMLYGASTGLAEPAPQTEYILVESAESASEGAWVAIYAGIDVNPAALSLT